MKPLVERLRQEYAGKVDFQLMNVDESKEANTLADKYKVQYVPTFIFNTAEGALSEQKVGELSEAEFKAKLETLLK